MFEKAFWLNALAWEIWLAWNLIQANYGELGSEPNLMVNSETILDNIKVGVADGRILKKNVQSGHILVTITRVWWSSED